MHTLISMLAVLIFKTTYLYINVTSIVIFFPNENLSHTRGTAILNFLRTKNISQLE